MATRPDSALGIGLAFGERRPASSRPPRRDGSPDGATRGQAIACHCEGQTILTVVNYRYEPQRARRNLPAEWLADASCDDPAVTLTAATLGVVAFTILK